MNLKELFKNTNYGDSLFTVDELSAVEERVSVRDVRGKPTLYIRCLVRDKDIKLTPEETVRQLYIHRLLNSYGYPANRLQVEYALNRGREVKRADIVIMDKLNPTAVYIIVEVKKPKLHDGKEQLKSYCNFTGSPIAVWTNGEQVSCYNRKDPNYFEQLSDIPKATETLEEILNERVTYSWLKENDKIAKEKRSLRELVKEAEDEVLANAGVDSFEEIFKLIFSKLYDELVGANDQNYHLQFRNSGDTDSELKAKIETLFGSAKKKWNGIFSESDSILLTPSHLSVCVSTLQDVKLFNNNLDVVDDAFEYLMSKSQKGEKGQYRSDSTKINVFLRRIDAVLLIPYRRNCADTKIYPSIKAFHDALRVQALSIEAGLNRRFDFDDKSAWIDMENFASRKTKTNVPELPGLTRRVVKKSPDPVGLLGIAIEEWGNLRDEMNFLYGEIRDWRDKQSVEGG